jgi:hypothetical protein
MGNLVKKKACGLCVAGLFLLRKLNPNFILFLLSLSLYSALRSGMQKKLYFRRVA